MKTDILIIGSGCAGLYCALNLPKSKNICVISKRGFEESDSFLAQGGMCMLKCEEDYESFFSDTMKAGHYENDAKSVEIMIKSSQETVADLVGWGARFNREENGELSFTREGAHSSKRIIFHKDITGKEITSVLLREAKKRKNITLLEYSSMLDILCKENICYGAVIKNENGSREGVFADYTVLATGGIGGLYKHSTNYRHLTGDGVAVALKHDVKVKNMNYVQIHPTTLYSKDENERSFLISESVRGEGAKLYGKDMQRFTDELLPRDKLTQMIFKQMEMDKTEHVWEDLRPIGKEEREAHFPNIVAKCMEEGYDTDKVCIPVVPAQHYFMGGIEVNYESKTSMEHLYAVGETACNNVHGRNRLASNSLLESLVFAKRAAKDIAEKYEILKEDLELYQKCDILYESDEKIRQSYARLVFEAINKAEKRG